MIPLFDINTKEEDAEYMSLDFRQFKKFDVMTELELDPILL